MAKVNTDLARERQKATFDTQDITFQLYTKKGTELRRMACKLSFMYILLT